MESQDQKTMLVNLESLVTQENPDNKDQGDQMDSKDFLEV